MRFQGSFDLPRGKTLCIVFIAQIEWVAKIGFLIGNDLGTFIKYYKISQLIHTQSIAN